MTRKLTFLILALFALISGPGWGQNYQLVTSTSDLVAGCNYVIGNGNSGRVKFMSTEDNNNNRKATADITVSTDGEVTIDNTVLKLELGGTTGAWTLKTTNYLGTNGYLASAASGNNNYCRVIADETTATISFSDNAAVITIQPHTSRNILRYNPNNGSPLFACYSSGQSDVYLYKESTPSTDPSITCANITDVPYQGLTNATATVTFTNADGWTPSVTCDGTIVTTASLSENTVTYSVSENEGNTDREGSFTITLSKEGEDDVDKVVSVTQKHFVIDYAELPFEWAGGTSTGLIALNGVTANGLGSDYAEGNAPYRVKFDTDGDYIQVKTDGQPGIVTIGTKMLGGKNTSYITIKASSDGENFDNGEQLTISGEQNDIVNLTSTRIFASDIRYVRMVFTKGSNVGVGPITIAKAETAYTVSIAQGIENGSISVSPTSAIAGSTITITPNAADGYILANYTIYKTEDSTDVTANVSLNGNTFTMPAYDVTVSATFEVAQKYTVTIAADIQNGEVISVENEYAEGATVQLMVEPNANYGLASWSITKDEDESVTEIVPVYNSEDETYEFAMPAYDITVLATFEQVVTYTRINNIDELIAGRPYIIIGEDGSKYYAMGSQANNNRPAIEIDADETTAILLESGDVHEFFISGDATNFYTFFDQSESGYLYAASSSSNYLKTKATLDNNGKWTIEIDEETGTASVVAQGEYSRKVMQYNSGNNLFSCYGSSSQRPVYLYMKDNVNAHNIYSNTTIDGDLEITTSYGVNNDAILMVTGNLTNTNPANLIIEDGAQLIQNSSNVMATFQKNITGYTGDNDNYYLIANPTANAVGEEDEYDALDGCTTFDLYTFDPTAELERDNIGQTAQKVTFDRNVGYLYANAQDMTLHFRGYLLPTNGTTDINLVYYTGGEAGREFPGFNLIGNPYTCNAYVNGYNFYTMADGEFVINEGSATVAPCEGFFVEATEANQSVTVSTAAPVTAPNALSLNVSQNRGNVIDRAIVRFDGANDLHKFMLNPAHTNLSIAKGGETFAAISTEAEGELPVNFKAEKNGTYTITVNTKNVDAEYLHLIDNMTGMDVDLLSTPSYTFEAKTSDYASRFKLVFGVNNTASESSDSNFAFMSDGNLVINNIEGEATLQIVDELGRVISTETVSGSYNKALNLKAGLYILNLNGMTQKIVVE